MGGEGKRWREGSGGKGVVGREWREGRREGSGGKGVAGKGIKEGHRPLHKPQRDAAAFGGTPAT